jgi:prevent-host-death family protein
VLNVLVPQVVLDGPGVLAVVGELVAAAVARNGSGLAALALAPLGIGMTTTIRMLCIMTNMQIAKAGMDMVTVSSVEFQRHFGRYQDVALTEPVVVTRNGRERLVVLSVDEYHRLKKRDRQVLALEDFTEADLKAIRAAEPPPEAAAFDPEVIG